jgi:hypothetical protein
LTRARGERRARSSGCGGRDSRASRRRHRWRSFSFYQPSRQPHLKPRRSDDRLSADRRLLTRRWLWDSRTARIDPEDDGNMYSFYYHSRLDFDRVGGGHARCEDLRRTCRRKLTGGDGEPPGYSYLREARTPDVR